MTADLRQKNIASNSHFKYELVESSQLPDNTVCYVDDAFIPHSYFNADSNNNLLYVRQLNDINNIITDIPVAISANNHTVSTLLSSIQSALDTKFGASQMTVTFDSRKLSLTVTENSGITVKLFADNELKSPGQGGWLGTINSSDLKSINELIGNYTAGGGSSTETSGVVDLRRYHNIYIYIITESIKF